MTLKTLLQLLTDARNRMPRLHITHAPDLGGQAWRADHDTGEIQLLDTLTPNQAADAFADAVTALDRALGNDVKPALRVVPTPRGGRDDERPDLVRRRPRRYSEERVAWQG